MSAITMTMAGARAEVLRLRKWPAIWVILGAWLALSLLFGYLFNYISYKTGSSNFAADGPRSQELAQMMPAFMPHVLIQGMPMFGGALVVVLGAVVGGNGFGWGTWKTVLTQGPSRLRVLGGSIATLTGVVVALTIASAVLDLGLSLLIAATEGQPIVWPAAGELVKAFGIGLLVLELWTLFGFLLGLLARGPALSVGLGLVWALVVENLLRGVGNTLDFVATLTHFLPGTAAGSLVGSLVGTGGGTPGVLDTLTGTRALVTVAAYVVALSVAALALFHRRDLT